MKAAAAVPFEQCALRALDVSQLLGVTPRTVVERLAKRPGFPKPIRHRPKAWIAADVIAWRNAQRAQGGTP